MHCQLWHGVSGYCAPARAGINRLRLVSHSAPQPCDCPAAHKGSAAQMNALLPAAHYPLVCPVHQHGHNAATMQASARASCRQHGSFTLLLKAEAGSSASVECKVAWCDAARISELYPPHELVLSYHDERRALHACRSIARQLGHVALHRRRPDESSQQADRFAGRSIATTRQESHLLELTSASPHSR